MPDLSLNSCDCFFNEEHSRVNQWNTKKFIVEKQDLILLIIPWFKKLLQDNPIIAQVNRGKPIKWNQRA
jgi:hypothetical protein